MVDVGAVTVFPFVAPATGDAAQGAEVEVGDTHGSLLAGAIIIHDGTRLSTVFIP